MLLYCYWIKRFFPSPELLLFKKFVIILVDDALNSFLLFSFAEANKMQFSTFLISLGTEMSFFLKGKQKLDPKLQILLTLHGSTTSV